MATPNTPQKKTGRPRKEIDLDMAYKLAVIHCTDEELASLLGISVDTLTRRKAEDPSFAELIEKGKAEGRASLRRMQYAAAQKGDRTMLVWLGKQLLGQRDYFRNEIANAPGETFKTESTNLKALSEDDLNALESILSKSSEATSTTEDAS